MGSGVDPVGPRGGGLGGRGGAEVVAGGVASRDAGGGAVAGPAGGAGGVNTAAYSRDTGGGGLAGRGSTLVVKVVENPMINQVNFEGNKEVKDTDLAKEVELRERMMFTRAKVLSDVNRIIAVYRRAGYYSVKVSPKIIRLSDNRVNVVYEINEGDETKVQMVDFVGNNLFGESRDAALSVRSGQRADFWFDAGDGRTH